MKFSAMLFSIVLMGTWAHGTTMGRNVFGTQMLISLASHSSTGGGVDSTPSRLYALMNVPEKPSNMGKGKALSFEKKVLNFVCSDRGQDVYNCAINIHKSAFATITNQKASFQVQGEAARALFEQFHSENGVFSFRDDSGLFAIEATAEKFLIVFSSNGV